MCSENQNAEMNVNTQTQQPNPEAHKQFNYLTVLKVTGAIVAIGAIGYGIMKLFFHNEDCADEMETVEALFR